MRKRVNRAADVVPLREGLRRGAYVGPDGQCAMERVLDVIANKWAVPILFVLTRSEVPVRFRALQRALGKPSQKELTRHLRELERFGLIARTVYPEVPPRVEYVLTALGRSLQPALQGLAVWGEEHAREMDANAALHDREGAGPDRLDRPRTE